MFLPLPFVLNAIPSATLFKILIFNPRTYRRRGRGGGGKGLRFKVFLSFFLDKKSASAPDVFSSCSVIPRADFETSLVMVSYARWSAMVTKSSQFWVKLRFLKLRSPIKVNRVAKIMQSIYLCVIFHVKHKKQHFSQF